MPSSRPNAIPTIVHVVSRLEPASILDVGTGFGKWGVLFREYTDAARSEEDPARYHKPGWRVRIDGVEGFEDYVTPLHRYVYDSVRIGRIQDLASDLPAYDVIYLGDVIEHMPKATGRALISELLERTNKALIVATPKYFKAQGDVGGNGLERHRCVWSASEFRRYPGAMVRTIDLTMLLAVIVKPGVKAPRIRPKIAGLPGGARPARLGLALPVLARRLSDALRRRSA